MTDGSWWLSERAYSIGYWGALAYCLAALWAVGQGDFLTGAIVAGIGIALLIYEVQLERLRLGSLTAQHCPGDSEYISMDEVRRHAPPGTVVLARLATRRGVWAVIGCVLLLVAGGLWLTERVQPFSPLEPCTSMEMPSQLANERCLIRMVGRAPQPWEAGVGDVYVRDSGYMYVDSTGGLIEDRQSSYAPYSWTMRVSSFWIILGLGGLLVLVSRGLPEEAERDDQWVAATAAHPAT